MKQARHGSVLNVTVLSGPSQESHFDQSYLKTWKKKKTRGSESGSLASFCVRPIPQETMILTASYPSLRVTFIFFKSTCFRFGLGLEQVIYKWESAKIISLTQKIARVVVRRSMHGKDGETPDCAMRKIEEEGASAALLAANECTRKHF